MDQFTSETPTHKSGWAETLQASSGDLTHGTSTTSAIRSNCSHQSGQSDQQPSGASPAHESVEDGTRLKKKKSKKKDKIDRDSSIDKRSVVKKAASPAPIEQSPGESPSPVWQDHNLTEDLFNNVAPDNFQQQEHFNAHSNNKVPINNYGGDYSEDESGDLSDTRSRASTISRGSTLSRGSARSRDSKLSAHDEQIRRMMMLGAKQPELNQGAERSIIPPARATYDDPYSGQSSSPHHLSPRLPSRASSNADAQYGGVEPTFSPRLPSTKNSYVGSQYSGPQYSGSYSGGGSHAGSQHSGIQYNGSYAGGGPHYTRSPHPGSHYDGSYHADSPHRNPGKPRSTNHSHTEQSRQSRDTPSTIPIRNHHETSQPMPDIVVGSRLADGMVETEGFEDDSSVNSDLTGLTGAFSMAFLSKDDSLTDDEQKPSPDPLVYPKYDAAASKFAMIEKMRNADEAAGTKMSKRKRPPLRFGTIQVRTFERILGDNPSTTSGAPIGIGWKFTQYRPQPLLEYESRRGPTRPSQHLVLSRDVREAMLIGLGYSNKEIAAAVRTNTKCRNNRRQTVQNLKAEAVEEKVENAVKGVMRLFGGRGDK